VIVLSSVVTAMAGHPGFLVDPSGVDFPLHVKQIAP